MTKGKSPRLPRSERPRKPAASVSQARRHAREVVVKTLYETDLGVLSREEAEGRITRRLARTADREFALDLLRRTLDNLARIDEVIAAVAENWELKRMAAMDLNTLRLGAAEIMFAGVPAKVAINEAIEIAKKFSTENSGGFVNGILDRVARTNREIRDNL
ncbi:MAG: transcription antitermination factor NusB [bacterium]